MGVYKLTASGSLATPRTVYTSMRAGNTIPGPAGIPDLYWWFDASDSSTITASGGKISQWVDKSSNGIVATQANGSLQPTYTTAGQNGLNVVSFTTHYLQANVSVTANAFTHFATYRWLSGGGGSNTYGRVISLFKDSQDDYSNTDAYETHLSENSWNGVTPPLIGGYRNSSALASLSVAKNTTYTYHCTLNGTAYAIVNGTSGGTTSSSGTTSATSINSNRTTIGAGGPGGGGDAYVYGYFCETILYKRVLSATEINTVRTYLNNKWGI